MKKCAFVYILLFSFLVGCKDKKENKITQVEIVDSTPPTVEITSPSEDYRDSSLLWNSSAAFAYKEQVTITVRAFDVNGIWKVVFKPSNFITVKDYEDMSAPWEYSFKVEEGGTTSMATGKICASAYDPYGNTSSDCVTLRLGGKR